jgi:UDP-N-acetylmuramate dehydrogenase
MSWINLPRKKSKIMVNESKLNQLREKFGAALQENVRLSNFATMNVGGTCDILLVAHSADDLAYIISNLWQFDLPVKILGSGSNLLISDRGVREAVVVNHAHNIKINSKYEQITAWAESGALMVTLGRQLALRGLTGMEWAATIPGTVGGAVYGNAGAFGGETCLNLISADVLDRIEGRTEWPCEKLDFTYRSSKIKRAVSEAVVLAATFRVERGDAKTIQESIENFKNRRMKNQPPGASVGSVFRNPPNDKAGRLIEAAGLKGKSIGGAIISPTHANFIINEGGASAQDVLDLLVLARNTVKETFQVELIPEIEVVGDWENLPDFLQKPKTSQVVHQ